MTPSRILRSCAALVLAAGLLPAQGLDHTCVVTLNGQSVAVRADGTFRISNIPAGSALHRLAVVCQRGGVTWRGLSGPVRIVNNRVTGIGDIALSQVLPPQGVFFSAAPDNPVLTPPTVSQTQVRVQATLTNGAQIDVSAESAGTTYTSSNPAIASIDNNGLVTGLSRGLVFITARNGGGTAVTRVTVSPGDPGTTVVGFAKLPGGTPVQNAVASIVGQTGSATTGSDGRFVIPGVLTAFGPIDVSVTATFGAQTFRGSSGPIEPVPGGLTDAGCIRLETRSETVVVHGGATLLCLQAGSSNLSVVEVSTGTVVKTVSLGVEGGDVATTADGRTAVVARSCTPTVAFYDLDTTPPSLLGTATVPSQGSRLAVTSTGFAILAGNSPSVASVSVATRSVVHSLPLPQTAGNVSVTPDGAFAVVTDVSQAAVALVGVSPAGMLSLAGVVPNPGGAIFSTAVAADGSMVMTANLDGSVGAFDLASGVLTHRSTTSVKLNPLHSTNTVVIRPDRRRAWALLGDFLSSSPREVVALDIDLGGNVTNTGIRVGGIPPGFQDMMAGADGGQRLLVPVANQTLVIDTVANAITGTIPTAGPARGVAPRGQ